MHVRACFQHGMGWLSSGFTARDELAMCCTLAALKKKRKVLVPLHLAYLPVK